MGSNPVGGTNIKTISYMRKITIVRTETVSGPKKGETRKVKREYMVSINASVPRSHKDFQNQHLFNS